MAHDQRKGFVGEVVSKTLRTMTEGANPKTVVIRSSILALASFISSIPYFYYLTVNFGFFPLGSSARDIWVFIAGELFLTSVLVFLCALVGFSFSSRYGLPGLGRAKEALGFLPHLIVIGGFMVFASYFLFDRFFVESSPLLYPRGAIYLFGFPLKGAFTDEAVLRLCLTTIGLGFFQAVFRGFDAIKKRRGWLPQKDVAKVAGISPDKAVAVFFVSALASLYTLRVFAFSGVEFGFEYLPCMGIFLSFASNLVLSYFFVTRGLLYSMALHFLFGMKYFLVALSVG